LSNLLIRFDAYHLKVPFRYLDKPAMRRPDINHARTAFWNEKSNIVNKSRKIAQPYLM